MDNEKNELDEVNVEACNEADKEINAEVNNDTESYKEINKESDKQEKEEHQDENSDSVQKDLKKAQRIYDDYYVEDEEETSWVLLTLASVIVLAAVAFTGLFVTEKYMGKQLIPGFSLVQGIDSIEEMIIDRLPGLKYDKELRKKIDAKKETETEAESLTVTEAVTEVTTEALAEAPAEVTTETPAEVTTEAPTEVITEAATEKVSEMTREEAVARSKEKIETEMQTEMYVPAPEFVEDDTYAFMQGPVAYKELVPYSGAWHEKELAGTVFSEFGCGMCCMANLYSTFTPYICSPLDMYEYAKETTDYNPGGGSGAIAWQYMQKALEKTGFATELHKKDEIYRGLVRSMERGWAAVALVSCDDDPSFWKTTPGHYVTIWDYDKTTRTVFLTDSGDPSHNRQRIPLQYVYSAFKTADEFQYLLITSYNEENNTWKHDGIAEKWRNPKDPETMKPDEKESATGKKEE